MMIQADKIRESLLQIPYSEPPGPEVEGSAGEVAEKLLKIFGASVEFISLIDRANNFLDMFVFFQDLDHALSQIKFYFADFLKSHYSWSRFINQDEIIDLESVPDRDENDPIPIDGGEFYREDPTWLENQAKVQERIKRLMLKRGEEDVFWFFDDPFNDENYLEAEISSHLSEIYSDLVEIKERIELLSRKWDEEAYGHIHDLIEFHTTHHVLVLFRPIQFLIGMDF